VPPTPVPTAVARAAGGGTEFVFAAAGDHGATHVTAASLARLDASGAAFYLGLGDLDYDQTATDEAWCEFVSTRLPALGPAFPFELVSGNHESHLSIHGDIRNHAACLPDRLGASGTYAAEYYFDYPAGSPLMRVIMIAANLNVGGEFYDYSAGTAHYNWLSAAIDSGRAAGIPWIVVGMHEVCLSTGLKTCQVGPDLMNLLAAKRVDLVLQAHDHNYQRSKQLAHSPACAAVQPLAYNPACVAEDGADGEYGKGSGTVFVVAGTFGLCCYAVNPADAEAGYFAVINATSAGFARFRVRADSIEAEFVPSAGAFTDAFVIRSGP